MELINCYSEREQYLQFSEVFHIAALVELLQILNKFKVVIEHPDLWISKLNKK